MNLLRDTKQALEKYGLKTAKSLGQNFLIDDSVLFDTIELSDINSHDICLEIGAGAGVLTKALSEYCKRVVSIEIDKRIFPLLNEVLFGKTNVTLINKDILKTDLAEEFSNLSLSEFPVKVVANLPYYITTPIIMKLLSSKLDIIQMTLMMQKEVADRIDANPGTKAYGSLSVYLKYFCTSKMLRTVPASCFYPRPGVDSALILLKKRTVKAVEVLDEQEFFKIVRAGFAKRRKTLLNSLNGYIDLRSKDDIKKLLAEADIDYMRRGETLTIDEFARLSNVYVRDFKQKGNI